MSKHVRALKIEVVSEGPPVRTLAEILRDPPKLELAGPPKPKASESQVVREKKQ